MSSSSSTTTADHYERLGWLIFGAAGCVIGWVFTHQLKVHERPIPAQPFVGSEDEAFFIKDLSFDLERPENDTVSTIMTYIYAGLIPIILQMALAWKFGPVSDIYDTLVVYLVTMGVSLLATEPVKWYVSWLRPNFYEMCEPDEETYTICQGPEPSGEARHSFPSGHSVTAFGGLTVLTYYLHFRYGVPAFLRSLRNKKRQKSQTAHAVPQGDHGQEEQTTNDEKSVDDDRSNDKRRRRLNRHRIVSIAALILPQGLALFISASRIRDNRHFPADVIAGALIGGITALFVAPLWWFETDGWGDDEDISDEME